VHGRSTTRRRRASSSGPARWEAKSPSAAVVNLTRAIRPAPCRISWWRPVTRSLEERRDVELVVGLEVEVVVDAAQRARAVQAVRRPGTDRGRDGGARSGGVGAGVPAVEAGGDHRD